MDEEGAWRKLGLDLPRDLQRYAGLREPDSSQPIADWHRAMAQVPVETIVDAEQFSLLLRLFAGADRSSSEFNRRWGDQVASEADRLMRYLDIRTACVEAAVFANQMNPRTLSKLAAGVRTRLGQVDEYTVLATLLVGIAESFIAEARAGWKNTAKRIDGEDGDWYKLAPEFRRQLIGLARQSSSIK